MEDCELAKIPFIIPLEDEGISFPIRVVPVMAGGEEQDKNEERTSSKQNWADIAARKTKMILTSIIVRIENHLEGQNHHPVP